MWKILIGYGLFNNDNIFKGYVGRSNLVIAFLTLSNQNIS